MRLFREDVIAGLVKQCRVDVALVAQVGHNFAFDQMLAKNRDLLLRA